MKIPFINLDRQYRLYKEKFDHAIHAVLEHGQYISGPEVKTFEEQLETFLGVKHAIGCANGTDALVLSLKALGVQQNEVVFVPSFTFAATAEAVAYCGGIPFFVDCNSDTYNLDINSLKAAIYEAKQQSLKMVGVIAVDLFGLAADYTNINELAKENNLWVMSDCAQGFGSTHKGKQVCSCQDCLIATTSFFPAKPLGCYGDGGAIFTNDDEIASLIRSLHIHGKGAEKYDNVRVGQNSRLDTIQAAILIEKLKLFPEEVILRNQIAKRYNEAFASSYKTPVMPKDDTCVWAQYTLQAKDEADREKAMLKFKERGIPTNIYYPKPLHQQTAYNRFPHASDMSASEQASQSVFSLPISPYLSGEEVEFICG